jgi:hypothetical protein
VGVRGLQVLDDGAELAALAVGEDARDLDVEGVAGEAVRGAEHPVDAQLRLAEVERVGVERRDGRDVDAEEEADGVLDALGRPLLPVHLDQHRREPALAHRVELERERVAEVAQDEVEEGLGRALEVEDVGPAIDVGEQQVRHLLQAGDEPEEVAGVSSRRLCFGSMRQRSKRRVAARGAEAGEARAVVGGEDRVAEEVVTPRPRPRGDVGRHLGVEREETTLPRCSTGDGDRTAGAPLGVTNVAPSGPAPTRRRRRARSSARAPARRRPWRGPVLDDERVHLVERGRAAHRLREHAHVDRGQAREAEPPGAARRGACPPSA